MARVQLQTLDAGVLVALIQVLDDVSRGRRIRMIPALLVRAALAAPDAIVRGLHASDAVREELAKLLVRRHATRRHLVQASHVNAVVVVVLLVIEHVLRNFRNLQAPSVPLVPHAFHAYPGVQALILVRNMLAVSRCIPVYAIIKFTTFMRDKKHRLSVGSCHLIESRDNEGQ